MIEYIKGDIAEITPATVVLDCNGMGYGINISLNTYSAIQNQSNTKLYIYEAIREDAYVLYGFSTKQERELFLLLISELCGVISSGNDKLLKTVKGIGLKTAQRIIVDLKDKIATSGVETVNSEMFANPGNTEIHDEAVAALTMLGFAQAASQKVVAAILKEEPAAPVEKVIKLALKRL
ncbi:MAG: Holliday junction branch migration protein RuvA [Phocaeicola vulgatus]|nr:Holliday junction branch migration protein RuvA [Phocaeicola vulgatus]